MTTTSSHLGGDDDDVNDDVSEKDSKDSVKYELFPDKDPHEMQQQKSAASASDLFGLGNLFSTCSPRGTTSGRKIKHRHHHHHCRRRRRLNRRRSVSPSRPRNRNDEYDPSCKLKCTFTTTKNYLLLVFYSLFLVSLVGTTPLTRKISALHISTTV